MRTICTNGVSNTTVTKNEESFKIFFNFIKISSAETRNIQLQYQDGGELKEVNRL